KPEPGGGEHRAGEQCCPVIRAIPGFATEKCSRDSDERGSRSERITAVMPRVRLNRGALGLSAEAIDVPKEDFFNDDNYNENGERKWRRPVMRRQDFADAFNRQTSRGCEHTQCDDDRGDWFSFAVTVRMGFIRRSRRHG